MFYLVYFSFISDYRLRQCKCGMPCASFWGSAVGIIRVRRSLVFVLRPSHGRRRGGLEERHPPAIPSWLIRKSELQCGGPSSFPDHDFASKKTAIAWTCYNGSCPIWDISSETIVKRKPDSSQASSVFHQ